MWIDGETIDNGYYWNINWYHQPTTPIALGDDLHFESGSYIHGSSPPVIINIGNKELDDDINSPGLPAFVVIGPPKSGTTSLVHTLSLRLSNFHLYVADNGENHFWNGGNNYVCLPDYCNITWLSFIKTWNNNNVKLIYLNHSIWTSTILQPQTCTKYKYESIWQWIMCHDFKNITDKTCYVPYKHHKNKYCKKNGYGIHKKTDNNLSYCYFIESAPSYLRNPLIGIMYAMNMPKTKLLGKFDFICYDVIYNFIYLINPKIRYYTQSSQFMVVLVLALFSSFIW